MLSTRRVCCSKYVHFTTVFPHHHLLKLTAFVDVYYKGFYHPVQYLRLITRVFPLLDVLTDVDINHVTFTK